MKGKIAVAEIETVLGEVVALVDEVKIGVFHCLY